MVLRGGAELVAVGVDKLLYNVLLVDGLLARVRRVEIDVAARVWRRAWEVKYCHAHLRGDRQLLLSITLFGRGAVGDWVFVPVRVRTVFVVLPEIATRRVRVRDRVMVSHKSQKI